MSISRDQLLNLHVSLTDKARETMKAKNKDYATDTDVFRNFRLFGGLGILVRLSDKLARLRSFEENDSFAVADEKLEDTIMDLINYGVLYYALKHEEDETQPCRETGSSEMIVGRSGYVREIIR